MTEQQREDLYIEWDRCGPARQKEMIIEFLSACDSTYSQEDWLVFLEGMLKVEEY